MFGVRYGAEAFSHVLTGRANTTDRDKSLKAKDASGSRGKDGRQDEKGKSDGKEEREKKRKG